MKKSIIYASVFIFSAHQAVAQANQDIVIVSQKKSNVLYGTASFYADKFEGRLTANGEIFSQKKMTAACNVLPFGTWIKVTNLKNGRSVVVRINDRLNHRMKRVVDLSKTAARKLGHLDGLIKVKVVVLGKKKPSRPK
jgi:rare lipoprotein A